MIVDLTTTDHTSYQHEGYVYIDQATFDLAVDHWRIDMTHEATDVTSIYDGSSDVTHALAWYDGDSGAHVAIVEFSEEAGGYSIDSLPFTLDIAAAVPTSAPAVGPQHFTVDIIGALDEITPDQLRAGIHGSVFRDDTQVTIRKAV